MAWRGDGPGGDVSSEREHGEHTLRVIRGQIVGLHGDDVFVDLAPRMQGVLSLRRFEIDPRIGEEYDFCLHGQEEGLWALSLESARPLASWSEMEVGSVVRARAVRQAHRGLECKVGELHAYMPRSHSGLPRDRSLNELVGAEFAAEVIEIDPERQRVFLSRKIVIQREKSSRREREVGSLFVGRIVQGRVTRIEDFGVFLRFGSGMEGLVHVSNLSYDRVEHPTDVLKMGENVEAKILYIKRSGKRIGLGIKQLETSPWKNLEDRLQIGQIIEVEAVEERPYGLLVQWKRGVVGLLHRSETLLREDQPLTDLLPRDHSRFSVRVLEVDTVRERLSVSSVHKSGAAIRPEEAAGLRLLRESEPSEDLASPNLGSILRRALESTAEPEEPPAS